MRHHEDRIYRQLGDSFWLVGIDEHHHCAQAVRGMRKNASGADDQIQPEEVDQIILVFGEKTLQAATGALTLEPDRKSAVVKECQPKSLTTYRLLDNQIFPLCAGYSLGGSSYCGDDHAARLRLSRRVTSDG